MVMMRMAAPRCVHTAAINSPSRSDRVLEMPDVCFFAEQLDEAPDFNL